MGFPQFCEMSSGAQRADQENEGGEVAWPSSFSGQSSHDPSPPLPTSSYSMRLGLREEGRTHTKELLFPLGLARPSQTCRGAGTEQGNVSQPPQCPAHRRHLINIPPSQRHVPAPACPLKGRGDRDTWWQHFEDSEVTAGGSQMSLFSARAPCPVWQEPHQAQKGWGPRARCPLGEMETVFMLPSHRSLWTSVLIS